MTIFENILKEVFTGFWLYFLSGAWNIHANGVFTGFLRGFASDIFWKYSQRKFHRFFTRFWLYFLSGASNIHSNGVFTGFYEWNFKKIFSTVFFLFAFFNGKDMIQILGFLELLFPLDQHLGVSKSKNRAWWDVYLLMLIFWLFFILVDKISRSTKFWAPIQNLNSVAAWEIPHLNWRYDFVRLLRKFCQNAWTSNLCAHLNNNVFWISKVKRYAKVVMRIRSA